MSLLPTALLAFTHNDTTILTAYISDHSHTNMLAFYVIDIDCPIGVVSPLCCSCAPRHLRQAAQLARDAHRIIVQFTDSLLADVHGTLLESLVKSIRSLLPNSPHGAQADSERRLLAECIFYIAYQTTSRACRRQVAAHAVRATSRSALSPTPTSAPRPALYTVDRRRSRVNSIAPTRSPTRLRASVVRSRRQRAPAARRRVCARRAGAARAALAARRRAGRAHARLGGVCGAARQSRRRRPLRDDGSRAPPPVGDADIEALFARAVRGGACLYLAQVTSSSAYRTSVDTRHLLAGVFDELVTGLLTHLSLTNFALCPLPTATSFDANSRGRRCGGGCAWRRGAPRSLNWQQRPAQQELAQPCRAAMATTSAHGGGGGAAGDDDGGNFLQLMQLVASLYRGEPELAHKFWTYDSSEQRPVRVPFHAARHRPRQRADFWRLRRHVGGAGRRRSAVADAASRMLCQGNKYVSWQHFFAALHGFLTDLTRTDSGLVIDPFASAASANGVGAAASSASGARCATDARHRRRQRLASMLRLMRVVLHHSEVARAHVLGKTPWRAPETLVALLTCAVPVRVKAALVGVTAALVTTRDVAWRVWKLLDACQLLRTRAAARPLASQPAICAAATVVLAAASAAVGGGGGGGGRR
jgi:hypothetical protein